MKKILYISATSGIAKSVVDKIKDKYYIYLTTHTESQLKQVKELYKENNNIECFKLDVTVPKDLEKIKALDIDILIVNSAIGYGGSISEISMDKVRENFEVNVFSNFTLIQIILKKMIEKGSGKIIIMASLAGIMPIKFLGVYSATKASIIALSRTLRNEIKEIDKDIQISIILPGMYHTGFNQVMLENKYKWMEKESYFKKQIPKIKWREQIFWGLFEKKNLSSITKKIEKCIKKDKPKFSYASPISQKVLAKIYAFIKE